MPKLKIINFVNPASQDKLCSCDEGYQLLVHCVYCTFDYKQTAETLATSGYYIPEDQFRAFRVVLDAQLELDLGVRSEELPDA